MESDKTEEAICDLDGNTIYKPSAKKWALVELSIAIAQDDAIVNKVFKFCQNPKYINYSLEDYLNSGTRFDHYLNKFPTIKAEYLLKLTAERQAKVLAVRQTLKKRKKYKKGKKK